MNCSKCWIKIIYLKNSRNVRILLHLFGEMDAFMKKKQFFVFLLLCFFTKSICHSQTISTDSLYAEISKTKNDSVRVKALNKLAFHYIFSDAKKARNLLNTSRKIALKSNCTFGYNEMVNNTGILMDVTGIRDSAKYFFTQSLQLSRKNKFRNLEVKSINNLGMCHWNEGHFNEALRFFLDALRINETLPKDQQIKFATCYNNIGLIYQELELNEKALEFHKKAYELRKKDNMLKDQASSLNNIGICYNSLNQTQKAIDIYKTGLEIAKQSGNTTDYLKIQENYGNALQSQRKYRESIAHYDEVSENPNSSPKMLIGVYGSLIAAHNKLNETQKALPYVNKGLNLIKGNPDLRLSSQHFYQYAAQLYYKIGDILKGETYNREFIGITNDIFSDENSRQIADYEIRYQTEKKEKQLAENKAKLLENQAEALQKNYILTAIFVLMVFVIAIAYLIFRQQKLKNSQLEQEHKLKTAIARIETQNELQQQRLNISRDLHDNIGAQLTFIISSVENIKYAFDIQNPKLDDRLQHISSFTKATIVELRDTIWAMNNNEITFDELRARVLNFIDKAKDATEKIEFKFRIDEALKNKKMVSLVGMNIYRTIQEAIHNAIKYSGATEITTDITANENQILVCIGDNGTGFDPQNSDKGNGLRNMQKRIEDIGGKFEVCSDENSGTTICFYLPSNMLNESL